MKNINTGLNIIPLSGDTNGLSVNGGALFKGVGDTSSTNTLLLQDSGGTTTMVVEDGGNVGIGTATPASQIHLKSNGSTVGFRVDSASINYQIYTLDSGGVAINDLTTIGALNDNEAVLKIANNASVLPRLRVDTDLASRTFQINKDGTGFYQGALAVGHITPSARLHVQGDGDTSSTDTFILQDSGGTTNFVVEDGGDVGIGTAAPTAKLDVLFNENILQGIKVRNTSSLSGAYSSYSLGNDTIPFGGAVFMNSSTNTNYGGASSLNIGTITNTDLSLFTNALVNKIVMSGTDGSLGIGSKSDNGAKLALGATIGEKLYLYDAVAPYGFGIQANLMQSFLPVAGSHAWGTGTSAAFTERMRLNSTGLGIGTILPTAKLHVDGSVRLSSLTTTPAAGYVLQSTDADGNADWVDVSTLVTGGTSGTVTKYAANSAFTASVALQIDHNMGSTDVTVQVRDSTGEVIYPDVINNFQTNSVDIEVSITGTYRVIITG